MKISVLCLRIAELEGKKKSISIAQIKEVVKILNLITGGGFYKYIRSLRYE